MKYILILYISMADAVSVAPVQTPYRDKAACEYAGSVWKAEARWVEGRYYACVPNG